MSIIFDEKQQILHIKNKAVSYIMEIVDGKYLVHRYFGPSVRSYHKTGIPKYFKRGYATEHDISIPHASFDDLPFEYPVREHGDFRIPAFAAESASGITYSDLHFSSFEVQKGKPGIPGLPSVFASEEESETLKIICEDSKAGIRIFLYYSVIGDLGVLLRHQEIENTGKKPLKLHNVQSLSLELPAQPYDVLSLYGSHAKEAEKNRFPLHHGIQRFESLRGSSSPQNQPFFALMSPDTSQEHGTVYGFHFIYSGNFLAQAECDQFGNVRAQIGIHPENFCWTLEPGETFASPEAVLNYSDEGLNGMSHNFHQLYLNHLIPSHFARRPRPVLLNSWEAMYCDVSLEKIETQAELAKKAGIELFVLDDGWFRSGNTTRTSMGDWICNENKLPGGISAAARIVHEKGLQFGLWFEPEAVGKDSILYQEHPDWVIHVPGYSMTEGRHEYLLDLSQEPVRNYIKHMLHSYLKDGEIDYIKWDMNRPLTNVNSVLLDRNHKGETSHRYILGLYDILNWLKQTYPELLVEGCSSGGARFDPGMLYYVPQIWASDNTDAYDRISIQDGFSLLYPPSAISSHVSITPNHQTGRFTSLETRYRTASLFTLGYELDLTLCSSEELKEIRDQIRDCRQIRSALIQGVFYRHTAPDDNHLMWSVVSDTDCFIYIMQKFHDPLRSHGRFHLCGLDADSDYQNADTGEIFSGDELMKIGITVPLIKEDFHVFFLHFQKMELKC